MAKPYFDLGDYVKQHLHAIRLRKRRMRVAKPVKPSKANELWYKGELLKIVAVIRHRVETNLQPVILHDYAMQPRHVVAGDEAPSPQQAAEQRRKHSSVYREIDRMAASFGGIQETAQRLSLQVVRRNLETVDERLKKSIEDSIGVDISPILHQEQIAEAMRVATDANLALITSIPPKYFEKLDAIITQNFVDGVSLQSMWKSVQHIGDITESRAKLIARDQTSKMNGAFNRVRQTSLGIRKYIWIGMQDGRERETHEANNGTVCEWDNPPEETGNPGDDVNCRCTGAPYFDLDAMEAELDAEEDGRPAA